MNETLETIFGLIGGLALFLYGMNQMSTALQKAAGDKMRQVLALLTKNPLLGAIAGALVTAVLQSSSATTVMAIGFVSAGLMGLPQAISIIFGANIGTTMTAQLMAFKISNYIYPIIFIGFIIQFIAKNEKVKSIGTVIFSFGLLFEGIEIMGSVMKPLASSPIFTDLMGKVADIPILGVLLGACMTLLVQSSSATIAVLQNFASQAGADGVSSVIGLTGAIPILLGDNIGTTITALLASIGQSKNAKRTAIAHSIFNISGSVVFLFLIDPFAKFVAWISPKGDELEIISRQIANAHTAFNIICTLVWLPLLPIMVKIVCFIIRGDDKPAVVAGYAPQYLDQNVLGQPVAAVYLVTEELNRCAEYAANLLRSARIEITEGSTKADQTAFDDAYTGVKSLEDDITQYITNLFSGGGLTDEQAEQAAGLLYVSNNIERIADRCRDITDSVRTLTEGGRTLSDDAKAEIAECFQTAADLFSRSIRVAQNGNAEDIQAVNEGRKKLRKAEKKFNRAHLRRVQDQTCDTELTAAYTGILYQFDRIADNCAMIAEEAQENVTFSQLALPRETESAT